MKEDLELDAPAPPLPAFPRLVCGEIELLPADFLAFPTAVTGWILPGGTVATTLEIILWARAKGFRVALKFN